MATPWLIVPRKRPSFVIIKLITMTNTYNIAGTDGNLMVPVLNETGSLMAYLLYPDPTGILQELYSCMAISRQYPGHCQAIPRQSDTNAGTWAGTFNKAASFLHNKAFGYTGEPIFQSFIHSLKPKKMAKSTTTSGSSADRIKNDPAFERTRENMAEFGRAGKAAKLLRSIFRDVTINAKDRVTQARLAKVTSRIITTDPVNERGARTVNNGDLQQLHNFHFNARAGISDSLFVRCPVNFNRVSGEVTVDIPVFVPRNMVQQARGTTHFRIVAAAAAINFDTERYEYAMQGTPELPFTTDPTQATTLTLPLPANSPDTVVAVLGIEYYQRVNSRSYALKSGEHNATSIVLVDKVA
ncbi:hypothetical protein [Niastella populi]|uniref:Uncharacterized protein n=1 Tax=Niastella populi TaxID=550983 RepID=A0A1V9FKX4_9BACT|nr:hypothetical protein [Niastella populi]OQP58931.1 hypothetical protein A4R26_22390 [Niastella populi]